MNSRKWLKYLLNEEKVEPKYDPNLSLIDGRIFDSLDMTSLSESEIKLLMEGRKENVLKKYGDKIGQYELEAILNFDEQYRYKHLNWMAKELAKEELDSEEQEQKHIQLIGAVQSFVRYGQNMKKRDINQYPDLQSLLDAIQQDIIIPKIAKARKERGSNKRSQYLLSSSQGTVVYEDERYFVVRPNTVEASCHFGAKTRWCIAQEGNSYFSQYTEGDGRAFYFIKDDTRKNEEFNYKMALEISYDTQYGSIMYHNLWDRHDEQYEIESDDALELMQTLVEYFEFTEEAAELMTQAISAHAEENPPDSPLAELEEKIRAGEWDGGFVSINAHLEDYDSPPYLMVTADVGIEYAIKNADIIQMLENGDIDIETAEDNIREAFASDGAMYEYLNEEVDIGASKWWWPSDESYDDNIDVSIRQRQVTTRSPVPLTAENPNAPTETTWFIGIQLNNFMDEDYGGTYSSDAKEEAKGFCEYMQEEWGERNEMEIMEVIEKHIFRFIPEVAETQAQAFLELRGDFVSGRHEIPNAEGVVYYTVDDDDEETSDLNLYMEFAFGLNPEYLDLIYNAEEFENASGNMVKRPNLPPNDTKSINRLAANFLTHDLGGIQTVKSHLNKAIYNIYQQAYEYSMRQLTLDFGPEWKQSVEDQWVLPETPEDINISLKMKGDNILKPGSAPLVPSQAGIELTFAIYIPFHKSKAELESIKRMFLFVRDNYDKINSYIGRYLIQYSNPEETRKGTSIMKENLLVKVLQSQMFLEKIKKQLDI